MGKTKLVGVVVYVFALAAITNCSAPTSKSASLSSSSGNPNLTAPAPVPRDLDGLTKYAVASADPGDLSKISNQIKASTLDLETVANASNANECLNKNVACILPVNPCTATDIKYIAVAAGDYAPTAKVFLNGVVDYAKQANKNDLAVEAVTVLADLERLISFDGHTIFANKSLLELFGGGSTDERICPKPENRLYQVKPCSPWPGEYSCKNLVSLVSGIVGRVTAIQSKL